MKKTASGEAPSLQVQDNLEGQNAHVNPAHHKGLLDPTLAVVLLALAHLAEALAWPGHRNRVLCQTIRDARPLEASSREFCHQVLVAHRADLAMPHADAQHLPYDLVGRIRLEDLYCHICHARSRAYGRP